MAWRVDPVGSRVDWAMRAATECQQTGFLPSEETDPIDEKLYLYVENILTSWAKDGVTWLPNKSSFNQVVDIAIYAGNLVANTPSSENDPKKIEAFYDDHLDSVESFYEKKIQPLKGKLRKESDSNLLNVLETIEVRVEMYAEKFGLILKNEDVISVEDNKGEAEIIGDIFELELDPIDPVSLQETSFPSKYVFLRRDTSDPQTDVESGNASKVPSPHRIKDHSDSPDSHIKKKDEQSKIVTAPKLERTSWIETPKEPKSSLTWQLNNPTKPALQSSTSAFRSIPKKSPKGAAPQLVLPELPIKEDSKLLKRAPIETCVEEESIPIAWTEEDSLFSMDL